MQQIHDREDQVNHDPASLGKILEDWHHEVEEILVHVFDLLYFYGPGEEQLHSYIKTIWISWSVIPSIRDRIRDYVVRTLCAALSFELRGGLGMELRAKKRVRRALLELLSEQPAISEYIELALNYLASDWEAIDKELGARRGLVQVAGTFLYSVSIATDIRRERTAVGAARWRANDFLRPSAANPLQFVLKTTVGHETSVERSLWMWYNLAFSPSPEKARG
jgi:hypothetical protein